LKDHFSYLISFGKKITLAFVIFSCCRLIFYLFNFSSFSGTFPYEVFFYGLRFDAVAIVYLFSPFIVVSMFPFGTKQTPSFKWITKLLFHLGNSLGIIFNLIDVGYFKYSQKRSTADLFQFLSTGNDFSNMLPTYIKDFWYLFVILILLIIVTEFLYRKFDHYQSINPFRLKNFLIQLCIFLVIDLLALIGLRGGIQLRPIDIINAANYTSSSNVPILLNTPFCIIKTVFNERMMNAEYFDEKTVKKIYNPELTIEPKNEFTGKNVVLIILESFAKEHVGFFNEGNGYTPFLDSLIANSYVFTNAYSNGTRSIESLPSIFAGIPPLMNTPYIISNFSANKIDALPAILKSKGYNTSFYHGGINGTMGFNSFCSTAGISDYYGKDEYPNKDKDDDGAWGIPDEPYLQYFAQELNKKPTPFFSSVFTLSSHHPYKIPEKYRNQFPEGKLPIHKTISYTDFALKQFFATAKKSPWFKNTLFVFTADHSSETINPIYSTVIGRNAIPTFIYDPSGEIKGQNANYFQHIDITPSLLSLLGIKTRIFSFGNDVFSNNEKKLVFFTGTAFLLVKDKYILFFGGRNTSGLFDLSKDSLLYHNLIDSTDLNPIKKSLETQLKAIIQQHNTRLNNNKTSLTQK
jgi:phosphoglycerol transferase MdoB-like AlkP superfamily enzyme